MDNKSNIQRKVDFITKDAKDQSAIFLDIDESCDKLDGQIGNSKFVLKIRKTLLLNFNPPFVRLPRFALLWVQLVRALSII